jgi:hypothetical protein
MTVRLENDSIVLEGVCAIEEAEQLVSCLSDHPGLAVDLARAEKIHTALWQVLLMVRPTISGSPRSEFAALRLVPILLKRDSATQIVP